MLIRLQRIYNFLLLHAILLSVLNDYGLIIHFYITFGTNLLTRGQPILLFYCLFQYFEEKEYQTESKRNETFGSVIFWKGYDPGDLEFKLGKV